MDGWIRGYPQRRDRKFAPFDRRNPRFAKNAKDGAPSSLCVVGVGAGREIPHSQTPFVMKQFFSELEGAAAVED